jgi:hypothetical protein
MGVLTVLVPTEIVIMDVMYAVAVTVVMSDHPVDVLMQVFFREMQPYSDPHEHRDHKETCTERLVQNYYRDNCPHEGSHRKVGPGASRTDMTETQHKQD